MLITGLCRLVLLVDKDRFSAVNTANIILTGLPRQSAGVQTDSHADHLLFVVHSYPIQAVMQRIQYLLPQTGSRMAGVADQLDLSRGLKAAPDCSGIVMGITAEIPVLLAVGGTGLAADILALDISHVTGTVIHRLIQTVVHIVHSLLTQDLLGFLDIVDDQITLGIINLREGAATTVDTVVCKGGISTGHVTDSGTVGQTAQAQRCVVHIRMLIIIDQIGNAEFISGKLKAVLQTDLIESVDRNCVDRVHDTTQDGSGIIIAFFSIVGECGTLARSILYILQRQILDNRCRCDLAQLKTGSIDSNRLKGRTDLTNRIGCHIPAIKDLLFTNAAGHADDVTGTVIDHHDAGLQLLCASGIRDLGQVRIDLIDLLLDIHINGTIDVIATALNQLGIDTLLFLFHGVPVHTVTLCQNSRHILHDRINEPGIHILGSIFANLNLLLALRAIVIGLLLGQRFNSTLIIAAIVLTVNPHITRSNTVLKLQLLCQSLLILLLCQIPLIAHCPQGIFFADIVSLLTGHHLALIFKSRSIGGKDGRVVGNTDQTGTFCRSQTLQLLTEIMGRCTLNTVFTVTKVNQVQIPLHDDVFIIPPFKIDGFKDLHNLTAYRNTVVAGHIFDQLLGNGGTTGIAGTHEHLHTGLHRCDPVNTLMLIKALILNGHCSVNQRLRELIIGCPFTVSGGSIDFLQFLNVAV